MWCTGKGEEQEVGDAAMPSGAIGQRAAVVCRLILALIFVVAGGSKLAQPWTFVHTVEGYRMLPAVVTRPFALALPWIEVLIGLYLLAGLFSRITAATTGMLLALFSIALLVQLVRGHAGNCGCVPGLNNPLVTAFVGGSSIGWWDVIRDLLLLLLALVVFLAPRPPLLAVDAWLAGRRLAADDGYGSAPGAA